MYHNTQTKNSAPTSMTANLFNAAIASSSISAAFDLGLLEALQGSGRVHLDEFCRDRELHGESIEALVYALRCFQIVELDPDDSNAVERGKHFAETYREKGYFFWLHRGYGDFIQQLSSLSRNKNRNGSYPRNGELIAVAGRDYGDQFVDAHFEEFLGQSPARFAADLGCGCCERLIKLAQRWPELRGVGVEINEATVLRARQSITAANLEDRLTIVQADVANLDQMSEFAEVDLIFCFFMAHDLWPRENCIRAFRNIRKVFPSAKRFLLSDTFRSKLSPSQDIPTFTLGFELTHAVMGQYIPTVDEWFDLFDEAGWHCVEQRNIGIPFSSIFDLRKSIVD